MSEPASTAELRGRALVRYCGIGQRPDAPRGRGICGWCGHPIVLIDPTDYRRLAREYHRGDRHERAVEVGGRTAKRRCRRDFNLSYVHGARRLIIVRHDPCCVDCGQVDGEWEADHRVPLVDGGTHDPTNIERRCVPCHRAKTRAEAEARSVRARTDGAAEVSG